MALNYTDNVIKISKAHYQTLVNGGTVETYTYDPHTIYLVQEDGTGDYLPLSGGTMTGNINMNSKQLYGAERIAGTGQDYTYIDFHDDLIHLTASDNIITFDGGIPAIYPEANADLGTDEYRWENGYFHQIYADGGGYQSSDKRLKNIHGEIDLDKAYNLIEKCSEIIYDLKDDEQHREQIGMIAQEVQEFFPEIISENKDGFLSLDYSKLTVIILRVLKDLIDRVKNLEEKK